ncbi:hypothetical protein [Pseudomonas atagonensis]|uniref:hypothetical protein n=1 Tax=Pseudomonas atagonensis TaxID=2609964 RepID=UPI001408AC3A|nr:hypothetical protein [Pseudomonas atagonensis]
MRKKSSSTKNKTLPSGSLDSKFGNLGKAYPPGTENTFGHANGVWVNELGTLFICGRLDTDYFVAGLKKDGTPYLTLNKTGLIKDNFGSGLFSVMKDISLTPGGEILVSGLFLETEYIHHHAFALYRQNGVRIKTFGNKGKVTVPALENRRLVNNTPITTFLQDGKILVSSTQIVRNGPSTGVLYRLNKDGSRDETFCSPQGYLDLDYNGLPIAVYETKLQQDGKILFAGSIYINGDQHGFVARYRNDFTPDTDFGNDGFYIIKGLDTFNQLLKIQIQDDGKILAVGTWGDANKSTSGVLLRLTDAGVLDDQFNEGKLLTTQLDGNKSGLQFTSVACMPDQSIIVQGNTLGGEEADVIVARYLPNGSLDLSFGEPKGPKGYVRTKIGSSVDVGHAMVLWTLGERIIVVGAWSIDGTAGGLRSFALRYLN